MERPTPKPRTNITYFYGHTKGPFKSFSNFYPSTFTVSNIKFTSSEQYIMYRKAALFKDKDIEQQILSTDKPAQIKKLGRKVKNFDPAVWDKRKEEIAYLAVYYKFSQNPEIAAVLLSDSKRLIAEAAPRDCIWGIGLSKTDALKNIKWRGKNLLGKTLVKVKSVLLEPPTIADSTLSSIVLSV